MKESRDIWKTVVAVTSGMGDILQSMRIPIYMALIHGGGINYRGCLKGIKDIAQLVRPRQRSIIPKAKKNGFLFCFPYPTPSNMNNIIPVALEAKKRGLLAGIILGRDVSREMIDLFKDIPTITFMNIMSLRNGWTDFELLKEAKHNLDVLFYEFRNITPDGYIRLKNNTIYLMRDLIVSKKVVQSTHQLFDTWSPSMIVSTSDFWPFEYQICHQGRLRGIPSSIVQHGVIGEFWWPFVANMNLLWGDYYRDKMLEIGADPERLRVCGMPSTDILFNKYSSYEVKDKQREKLVCLIISQTEPTAVPYCVIEMYNLLIKEVISNTPNISWKIKLHPRESNDFYIKLNRNLDNKVYVFPKSTTLENAVLDSDIVFSLYSTAGLEAMMMRKPLIILDVSPEIRTIAWWPSLGGGIYCNTAENIYDIIKNIVVDSEYRKYIMEKQDEFINNCFANRGKATESVIELLEKYPG